MSGGVFPRRPDPASADTVRPGPIAWLRAWDGESVGGTMRYDRHGFPIPPEFERPPRDGDEPWEKTPGARREPDGGSGAERSASGRLAEASRRRGHREGPSPWKRWFLVLVLLGGVLPAVLAPAAWPLVRDSVVLFALERATQCEARNDLAGAVRGLNWALRWHGDDVDLLCMRAALKLENGDPRGAFADASRAATLAPTAVRPWQVRALVNVVLADFDAALSDAGMVVSVSAAADPEALNHRAYVRALVGRDLEEGLADIERALEGLPEASPELLDTRGYILHLLGRQREALDELNVAIGGMQKNRKKLAALAGRVDPAVLACRLRAVDHGLAVMLQHRALACRALGLEEQARQDLEQAKSKGYDPRRGIF